MMHLNFTQMLRICPTGHLIGIKRESNDSPNLSKAQTSLNSDIKSNFGLSLHSVVQQK